MLSRVDGEVGRVDRRGSAGVGLEFWLWRLGRTGARIGALETSGPCATLQIDATARASHAFCVFCMLRVLCAFWVFDKVLKSSLVSLTERHTPLVLCWALGVAALCSSGP